VGRTLTKGLYQDWGVKHVSGTNTGGTYILTHQNSQCAQLARMVKSLKINNKEYNITLKPKYKPIQGIIKSFTGRQTKQDLQEITDLLRDQGVSEVTQIYKMVKQKHEPTCCLRLTFTNTSKLPTTIELGLKKYNISPYRIPVARCTKCCTKKQVCLKCGQSHPFGSGPCTRPNYCTNCKSTSHNAGYGGCTKYLHHLAARKYQSTHTNMYWANILKCTGPSDVGTKPKTKQQTPSKASNQHTSNNTAQADFPTVQQAQKPTPPATRHSAPQHILANFATKTTNQTQHTNQTNTLTPNKNLPHPISLPLPQSPSPPQYLSPSPPQPNTTEPMLSNTQLNQLTAHIDARMQHSIQNTEADAKRVIRNIEIDYKHKLLMVVSNIQTSLQSFALTHNLPQNAISELINNIQTIADDTTPLTPTTPNISKHRNTTNTTTPTPKNTQKTNSKSNKHKKQQHTVPSQATSEHATRTLPDSK
jgi:hypothetical protein